MQSKRNRALGAALLLGLALPGMAAASSGQDIIVEDVEVFPENITSSPKSGRIWIGSVRKGAVYLAEPGARTARTWIAAGTAGMKQSMGLWADDKRGLLWVCVPGERATQTQPAGETAIKTFDLKTAAFRASYSFDGGGRCNDLTIAADGTPYATDFDGGRILRLAPGDDRFRLWAEGLGAGADGIAQLADGHIYVNNYRTGALTRVPMHADGSAGAPVSITTDRPLAKPDGMRASGRDRLILTEGEGRLVELTVSGDRASITLLKDGLTDSPTGVTIVKNIAYVVQAKWAAMREPEKAGEFRVIAVPLTAARTK